MAIAGTVGVGLITMLKDCVAPSHELAEGVTVKADAIGAFVLFDPTNERLLLVPLTPRPMPVLRLVQL